MFHHLHSYMFESDRRMVRVVRTGWVPIKTSHVFIWKSYYRLVDILTHWLQYHVPPGPFLDNVFNHAFHQLTNLLEEHKLEMVTCTAPELECLQYTASFGHDRQKMLMIDDRVAIWVYNLLLESPSLVFGDTFRFVLVKYKLSSMELLKSIDTIVSREESNINVYLQEYYRQLSFSVWPISYHMANELSAMSRTRPKDSSAQTLVSFKLNK